MINEPTWKLTSWMVWRPRDGTTCLEYLEYCKILYKRVLGKDWMKADWMKAMESVMDETKWIAAYDGHSLQTVIK